MHRLATVNTGLQGSAPNKILLLSEVQDECITYG